MSNNWKNPTKARLAAAKTAALIAGALGWNGGVVSDDLCEKVTVKMAEAGHVSKKGTPYSKVSVLQMLYYAKKHRRQSPKKEPQTLSRARTDGDRETLKLIKIVVNSPVSDGQKVRSIGSLLESINVEDSL